MSRGYRNWPDHGEAQEPLVWERVTWRQGDGRYMFEVAEGGLFARLSSPHGTSLTLPMVAWEGLLDAISGARKTRARNERGFPARSGARWYDGEAGELAAAFQAGCSVAQLARAHNRSEFAVEAQLDRMGLWDRATGQPVAGRQSGLKSPEPSREPSSGPSRAPPREQPGVPPREPSGVQSRAPPREQLEPPVDGARDAHQGPAPASFGAGRGEAV
jgi:hypothetical protein